MDESFSTFISRERERLHAEREAIFNQQHELEQKLAAINNEMRAIDAYEAAKTGKPTPAPRQVRGGRQTTVRTCPRALPPAVRAARSPVASP